VPESRHRTDPAVAPGYRELTREIDRTAVPVGIRDALDRARIAAPGILDVDTIDARLRQMPAHTLEPFSLVLRPRETEYGVVV
jgi:hypothetical protein